MSKPCLLICMCVSEPQVFIINAVLAVPLGDFGQSVFTCFCGLGIYYTQDCGPSESCKSLSTRKIILLWTPENADNAVGNSKPKT